MPRKLRGDYAWDDGADDDGAGFGRLARAPAPRGPQILFGLAIALLAAAVVAVAGSLVVQARQEDDAFCVGCHTAPHMAYRTRAEASLAGAYALDLSSYHYQQIRGTGGAIRCIDCHRGDGSVNARMETLGLSAEMALLWLAGGTDDRIEKVTITSTRVISRDGGMVSLPAPVLRAPALSNDGCVGCHKPTLLTAGMDNHTHNMLPAAYALWRSGERLIAPPGTKDVQGLLAQGLTPYKTTLQCGSCHTGHQSLEVERYLDRAVLAQRCDQCHLETRGRK